jgi:DNA/RNA endonuclease YhcR with UshA esterase domain
MIRIPTPRLRAGALLAGLLLAASQVGAHHSFAVHYDSNKPITKEGIVTEFRFTNPHGILMLDVTNEAGEIEHWTVETTAPVYLRRFGWTKDSVKAGDHLIVDGWASRDGSHFMRIRSARRADDGTMIGRRSLEAGDE